MKLFCVLFWLFAFGRLFIMVALCVFVWALVGPPHADCRLGRAEIQAMRIQLVGSQPGNRRGAVPGVGHTRLLQRSKCRIIVQRGPNDILCHLQHSISQYNDDCVPVRISCRLRPANFHHFHNLSIFSEYHHQHRAGNSTSLFYYNQIKMSSNCSRQTQISHQFRSVWWADGRRFDIRARTQFVHTN